MTILTPLAVSHADVLKEIAGQAGHTANALATLTGRVASNIRRDMPKLVAEDLVTDAEGRYELTAKGRAVLEALDRADGVSGSVQGDANAVRIEPAPAQAGVRELLHREILPDPRGLNPRKHFDETELAELAESIARDDLLENLVVRTKLHPDDTCHLLVAGERRWRAIGQLIKAGRWPDDKPVPVKVVDIDDAAHRRLALVENLQRKDLRPIDEAYALKELMDLEGQGTAEIAAAIGFTQRFVQQRLQLLELPDAEQQALQDGRMSIEQARQWLSNRPKPLELTDRQMLIVAESLHRMRHQPRKGGYAARAATEVSFKADTDGDLKALCKLNVFSFTAEDWSDRRAYLSRSWAGREIMDRIWPQLADVTDNAYLGELRRKAARAANVEAAEGAGAYLTGWLNGPFELSPASQRKLEEDKARKAKEKDQSKKEKEKRARALESFQAFDRELREAASPPVDPRAATMLKAVGLKLPLAIKNGRVVDAQGEAAFDCSWRFGERGECVNLLLASLVNAAAGYGLDPDDAALTPAERRLAGIPSAEAEAQ